MAHESFHAPSPSSPSSGAAERFGKPQNGELHSLNGGSKLESLFPLSSFLFLPSGEEKKIHAMNCGWRLQVQPVFLKGNEKRESTLADNMDQAQERSSAEGDSGEGDFQPSSPIRLIPRFGVRHPVTQAPVPTFWTILK